METCIGIFCACVVPTVPLYTTLVNKSGLRRVKITPRFYQTPIKRRAGHRLESMDEDITRLQPAAASPWEGVRSKVTADHKDGADKVMPMNAIDVERGLEWTSERI